MLVAGLSGLATAGQVGWYRGSRLSSLMGREFLCYKGRIMDVIVRVAEQQDIPDIVRLWWQMMDYHAMMDTRFRPLPAPEAKRIWEKHLREDLWDREAHHILVAEVDGQMAGMMIGALRAPYPVFEPERFGFVVGAAVGQDARRSGIGRALFEALKAWFREQGVASIQLEAGHHNPTSQPFWRAMGFTNYMDVMWADLEEAS